ncbi:MAG: hypothetical protein H7222_08515 [Methylotenera sp.]|nr:hypothetical protein [Oligoflexia bacterium]
MNFIRKELTDDELKAIGKEMVEAVNIPLFNSRPKQKMVVWCFHALKDRGYDPINLDEPLMRIPEFFARRTEANQVALVRKMFGVLWDPDLGTALTLRYKNVEVSENEVEALTVRLLDLFARVTELDALGLTPDPMKEALRAHYRLEHYQDPDDFDLDRLFDCLKQQATKQASQMTITSKVAKERLLAFETIRSALHPERKAAIHEWILTPGEVEWLEAVVAASELTTPRTQLSQNPEILKPYEGEIKISESLHSPEVMKIQHATRSFNSLLSQSLEGGQNLTPEAGEQVRRLICQSVKSLLASAVAESKQSPEAEENSGEEGSGGQAHEGTSVPDGSVLK